MIGALHGEVEKVVDHQHFRLPTLEAAGVDNAGNDHLKTVDAAHSSHRYEDPMPRKQLYNKSFHARGSPGGPPLHDNVTYLSHLVPGAVEDWQASDA